MMSNVLRMYKQERLGMVGAAIVLFFAVLALLGPWISPYDPFTLGDTRFAPPNAEHIMGTDEAGRDIFSQFLHGARTSLMVGGLASLITVMVGSILGSISGFYVGKIDSVLMRATEAFMIIPRFFLALLIVAIFGPSLWNVILVIGLLGWPSTARLLRSQFLSIRETKFVEAARVIGASNLNIIWDEILPNAFSPVIVSATLDIGHAILLEAEMSFLGLGDPNLWSWGYMIFTGKNYLTMAPWLVFFPGIGICLIVIAFALIGETLSKMLSPRSKTRL